MFDLEYSLRLMTTESILYFIRRYHPQKKQSKHKNKFTKGVK